MGRVISISNIKLIPFGFILLAVLIIMSCQLLSSIPKTNSISNNFHLEFIENKGQFVDQHDNVCKEILFAANSNDGMILLRKTGFSYIVNSKTESNYENDSILVYRNDIEFLNCLPKPELAGLKMSKDYINYYLSQCPGGILNVRKFKSVKYKELYENIDLVCYSNVFNDFEYDFIVRPGGDPNNIRLKISNAEDISIIDDQLRIKTIYGEIIQSKPCTYQLIDGIKTEIESHFIINKDRSISFKISEYDTDLTIVIDPVLRVWGSFYGGDERDILTRTEFTADSNLVACGCSYSNTKISSENAWQKDLNGYQDGILIKFDLNGNRIWSTYYGGSDRDHIEVIETDNQENIFVYGTTYSLDVLGNGGWQEQNNGESDLFLAKFNSAGERVWGTFYGGTEYENPFISKNQISYQDMAVDSAFNIYITGHTESDSLVGIDAWQYLHAGNYDVFIAKFDSSGNKIWDTYYGGTEADNGYGIAYCNDESIVLLGYTFSRDVFATEGAWQEQLNTGENSDAFIAKFDCRNGNRIWSTYYGGSEEEMLMEVSIAQDGKIYTSGFTNSKDMCQTPNNGNYDIVLACFSKDGERLWDKCIGGSLNDHSFDVEVNNRGYLYLSSGVWSDENISLGAFQDKKNGSRDAFIAKYDTNGRYIWGTYYGGSCEDTYYYNDHAFGIAVKENKIVACGRTCSRDVFGEGGFQTEFGGGEYDAWLVLLEEVEFDIGTVPNAACPGSILTIPYKLRAPLNQDWEFVAYISDPKAEDLYAYEIGRNISRESAEIEAHLPSFLEAGDEYKITVAGANNVSDILIYRKPKPSFQGPVYVCSNSPQTYQAEEHEASTYHWHSKKGVMIDPANLSSVNIIWPESGKDTLVLTESNIETGCKNIYQKEIQIEHWDFLINGRRKVCKGNYRQSYYNLMHNKNKLWLVKNGYIVGDNDKDTVIIEWLNPGMAELSLILTDPSELCSDTSKIEVEIDDADFPYPKIEGRLAVCDSAIEIYSTPYHEGNTYLWEIKGGTPIGSDSNNIFEVLWGSKEDAEIKLSEWTPLGCKNSTTEKVWINSHNLEIIGERNVYPGAKYPYYVKNIPGTSNKWSATNGQLIGDNTADTVHVIWCNSGIRMLTLEKTTYSELLSCSKTLLTGFIENGYIETIFSIPEIEEDPSLQMDNIVSIPVLIDSSGHLQYFDEVDSLQAFLRLRKTMFLPLVYESQYYYDSGLWRTISISTSVSNYMEGDTILSVQGYVLLGDTLETPIYIDSIKWSGLDINSKYKAGSLKLTGVTDIGGLRLLKSKGIDLLKIYPNPVSNQLKLIIFSTENNIITIEISSILGEKVFKESRTVNKGINEIEISLGNQIISGVYQIVLRSNSFVSNGLILQKE